MADPLAVKVKTGAKQARSRAFRMGIQCRIFFVDFSIALSKRNDLRGGGKSLFILGGEQ